MPTFALEKLFNDVRASMAIAPAELPVNKHFFGWREPDKQLFRSAPVGEVNRFIVWVPGDDGDAGVIEPARYPGRNPRPLATLDELFTCYIHAEDPSDRTNEFLQWSTCRALFDAWLRHVYLAAYGTFSIKSSRWVTDKNEHRAGATLRVVGGIMSMVADKTEAAAPVDTHGEITPTLINPPGTGTDDILIVVQPD